MDMWWRNEGVITSHWSIWPDERHESRHGNSKIPLEQISIKSGKEFRSKTIAWLEKQARLMEFGNRIGLKGFPKERFEKNRTERVSIITWNNFREHASSTAPPTMRNFRLVYYKTHVVDAYKLLLFLGKRLIKIKIMAFTYFWRKFMPFNHAQPNWFYPLQLRESREGEPRILTKCCLEAIN